MIKTVKVEKKLRLDELIKYVWDNDIQNRRFRSNESDVLVLVEHGRVLTEWTIEKCETFTVEVEEEITKDTKFTWLVEASDRRVWTQSNASIGDVVDEETNEIRALINGKLQLIWEAK